MEAFEPDFALIIFRRDSTRFCSEISTHAQCQILTQRVHLLSLPKQSRQRFVIFWNSIAPSNLTHQPLVQFNESQVQPPAKNDQVQASAQFQNGLNGKDSTPDSGMPGATSGLEDNIESQESSPSALILFRYLHKTDEGDIITKQESPNPIQFKPDESAEGLTAETVLEILTTRISRGKSNQTEGLDIDCGTSTVMRIHSIHLINALREVITYYPSLKLRVDTVTIPEPYEPLVHYMKELLGYKIIHPEHHDERYTTITNEHIDVLLGFLDRTLGSRLRSEHELHQRPTPMATYENLWMLFKPGQDIYVSTQNGKFLDPMVLAEFQGGVASSWNLKCESGFVRPIRSGTEIPWFDGEKEITSLSAYPKHFHPENDALEARFIERGKKYWSLCEPSYQEHTGQTLHVMGRPPPGWVGDLSNHEFSATTVCNSVSEEG